MFKLLLICLLFLNFNFLRNFEFQFSKINGDCNSELKKLKKKFQSVGTPIRQIRQIWQINQKKWRFTFVMRPTVTIL